MSIRAYYNSPVPSFIEDDDERIIGVLTKEHHHALEQPQLSAWLQQLSILRRALVNEEGGHLFLEFYIPRMGKRADAVLISEGVIFVLEFKVGAQEHTSSALEQVEDYALDLKNFHEGSHSLPIVPVLISTNATTVPVGEICFAIDSVASTIKANDSDLATVIRAVRTGQSYTRVDVEHWMAKGYKPTPTIIEAAETLYRTHSVADISRSDAGAKNLQQTAESVSAIIDRSRRSESKSICFVTGVPGSGKTLAGLNIATRRSEEHPDEDAVFLSGNGPLVDVLREALIRDKRRREGTTRAAARRPVQKFIQNVHHFRDEHLRDNSAPSERVVVFDEAQRAWTRKQAASFMQRKRAQADFDMSEPEFLLSVMDRHKKWCTVVCLIGGGQEINTGEAGILEWINALERRFTRWNVFVSPRIVLPEYGSADEIEPFLSSPRVNLDENLHLGVSMRSFRAEALSNCIGHIVENEPELAKIAYGQIETSYPIVLTRDLHAARAWLRRKARGTERIGLVASSGAQRLRPEGVHIKADVDPASWFLNNRQDVRSSYYLEETATEFDVQGLELDWVGVCWDGDFHQHRAKWVCQSFKGSKWQSINDQAKRLYLKNAYRVLLTRARQGMVIFVPNGNSLDHTRPDSIYDGTFEYLRLCGLPVLA